MRLTPPVLLLTISCLAAPTLDARPNIILIVADDLGYADLSCYGRKDYTTPALDQLAREGVRFTQAYAAAPVCTPSRLALLTGRYPGRVPVGLCEPLTDSPAHRTVGLSPEHPTLPSLLAAAGYDTVLVGKWHLGYLPEFQPNRHGFAEYFGILAGAADYTSHLSPAGNPALYHNTEPVTRDGYMTDLLTEQVVAYLSAPRSRPFFLSVQYTAVHWPWQAPGDPARALERTTDPTTGVERVVPAATVSRWNAGGSPETFAAMMRRLDAGVAQIMQALENAGLRDNTIVLFTSDNGGEHHSDMGPLTGSKLTLHEGGIRVPLIVRWPGVAPAGQTTDQVAVHMDLTATILGAAGVAPAPTHPLEGIDLTPFLRAGVAPMPRTIAWRIVSHPRHKALRHGDWKYFSDGTTEFLFDLATDLGEKRDCRPEFPEVFADLAARHRAWEAHMLSPQARAPAP